MESRGGGGLEILLVVSCRKSDMHVQSSYCLYLYSFLELQCNLFYTDKSMNILQLFHSKKTADCIDDSQKYKG